jgi:hypothetical protein
VRHAMIALIPFLAAAQELPLRGQTWVFVNGPNEDTHIVNSVAGFEPSSVIVARFNDNGTADIRYSNLSGRFLRSTTEALETIDGDLRRNVLPGSRLFQASRQGVPDTAYSCDEELARLSGSLRYSQYFTNGEAVTPVRESRSWRWYFDPPECHASRPATAQDRQEKDLCQDHWCSDPVDDPAEAFREVCKDDYTECRYVIDESTHRTRGSTRSFWNLHIYPRIVYHPRHHVTGRIMKEITVSLEEAEEMRRLAIANQGDEDLKPYLNPVLDDSASVWFSGQFLDPPGNPDASWSLSLDIPPEGEGATVYTHDPPRAYRIASFDDWIGLRKALLLPFAEDPVEEEFLANLDTRCPGWMFMDRWIGQRAFSVRDGLDVTLPDVLPPETTDPGWKVMRQERVQVNGGWEVRTIVDENRVLKGQKALVRNLDFPYGDFFWKGCPDLDDAQTGLTKAQVARLLARPVPTCNLEALSRAPDIYRRLGMRFRRPDEEDERHMASRRAQEAEFQYDRIRNKERPEGLRCPESHLDQLVRRFP